MPVAAVFLTRCVMGATLRRVTVVQYLRWLRLWWNPPERSGILRSLAGVQLVQFSEARAPRLSVVNP